MAATKTTTIFGILALLIVVGSYFMVTYSNDLRMKVELTDSTFYTNINNRWLISGVETLKLYNGTKMVNRQLTKSNISYIDLGNNRFSIIRNVSYSNGASIVDTYSFEGNLEDKTKFPVSHEIRILNAKGLIFQNEFSKLEYSGETISGVTSPMSFGKNMRVEWDKGNYYSKIYKYADRNEGKLTIKYRINSSEQVIYTRLFDPPLTNLTVGALDSVTLGGQVFYDNVYVLGKLYVNETIGWLDLNANNITFASGSYLYGDGRNNQSAGAGGNVDNGGCYMNSAAGSSASPTGGTGGGAGGSDSYTWPPTPSGGTGAAQTGISNSRTDFSQGLSGGGGGQGGAGPSMYAEGPGGATGGKGGAGVRLNATYLKLAGTLYAKATSGGNGGEIYHYGYGLCSYMTSGAGGGGASGGTLLIDGYYVDLSNSVIDVSGSAGGSAGSCAGYSGQCRSGGAGGTGYGGRLKIFYYYSLLTSGFSTTLGTSGTYYTELTGVNISTVSPENLNYTNGSVQNFTCSYLSNSFPFFNYGINFYNSTGSSMSSLSYNTSEFLDKQYFQKTFYNYYFNESGAINWTCSAYSKPYDINVSDNYNCYQETATRAYDCGGYANGTYQAIIDTSAGKLYDGNPETGLVAAPGGGLYENVSIIVNYTKPSNLNTSRNSSLKTTTYSCFLPGVPASEFTNVKSYYTETIPSSCMGAYADKVSIKIENSSIYVEGGWMDKKNISFYCKNSTGWQSLNNLTYVMGGIYPSCGQFFLAEEGIDWGINYLPGLFNYSTDMQLGVESSQRRIFVDNYNISLNFSTGTIENNGFTNNPNITIGALVTGTPTYNLSFYMYNSTNLANNTNTTNNFIDYKNLQDQAYRFIVSLTSCPLCGLHASARTYTASTTNRTITVDTIAPVVSWDSSTTPLNRSANFAQQNWIFAALNIYETNSFNTTFLLSNYSSEVNITTIEYPSINTLNTLNSFNDSTTSKNLTFTGNQNQTAYVSIPKFVNVTNGSLELSGFLSAIWLKTGNDLTITIQNVGSSHTTFCNNTIAFIAGGTHKTLTTYNWNGTNWNIIGNTLSISDVINYPSITSPSLNRTVLIDKNYGYGGFIRTYDWNGTNWNLISNQTSTISLNSLIVSLTETRIVIGNQEQGNITTYDWNGTGWYVVGNSLFKSINQDSNAMASINATRIILISYDSPARIYTYDWNGTNWNLISNQTFELSNQKKVKATLISENKLAIYNGDSGNLTTYNWDGANWNLIGSLYTSTTSSHISLSKLSDNMVTFFGTQNDKLQVYNWSISTGSWYPSNVSLQVGNTPNIFNQTGNFTTTNTTSDFSSSINSFLSTCTADINGNCQVPLLFHSDTAGILNLFNMEIEWRNNTQINWTNLNSGMYFYEATVCDKANNCYTISPERYYGLETLGMSLDVNNYTKNLSIELGSNLLINAHSNYGNICLDSEHPSIGKNVICGLYDIYRNITISWVRRSDNLLINSTNFTNQNITFSAHRYDDIVNVSLNLSGDSVEDLRIFKVNSTAIDRFLQGTLNGTRITLSKLFNGVSGDVITATPNVDGFFYLLLDKNAINNGFVFNLTGYQYGGYFEDTFAHALYISSPVTFWYKGFVYPLISTLKSNVIIDDFRNATQWYNSGDARNYAAQKYDDPSWTSGCDYLANEIIMTNESGKLKLYNRLSGHGYPCSPSKTLKADLNTSYYTIHSGDNVSFGLDYTLSMGYDDYNSANTAIYFGGTNIYTSATTGTYGGETDVWMSGNGNVTFNIERLNSTSINVTFSGYDYKYEHIHHGCAYGRDEHRQTIRNYTSGIQSVHHGNCAPATTDYSYIPTSAAYSINYDNNPPLSAWVYVYVRDTSNFQHSMWAWVRPINQTANQKTNTTQTITSIPTIVGDYGIVSATLTNISKGNISYYLTADGINYEAVTPNIEHTFSNFGGSLAWRAIFNEHNGANGYSSGGELPHIKFVSVTVPSSYPTNLTIDYLGDGTIDAVINGELNSTVMLNFSNVTLNAHLGVNAYNNNTFLVPIAIKSVTNGRIGLTNLNLVYTFNPIYLALENIRNYVSNLTSTGYVNVPVFMNATAGTLNVTNINYDYAGGNKTYKLLAHNDDYSKNVSYDLNFFFSRWDYNFVPAKVQYLEFIPMSPTSKNVSAKGQSNSTPILNITNYGYYRYGPDGTVSGGVTIEDEAMVFDGVDDYVNLGNSSVFNFGTNDFSINFWAKSNNLTSIQRLISKRSSSYGDGFSIEYLTNKVNAQFLNETSNININYPATTITDWNMYSMIRVGNNLTVCSNNVCLSSVNFLIGNDINTANSILLGVLNGFASSSRLNGSIDDVQIYNRALSASEITAQYNLGRGKYALATNGLIAQYSGRDFAGTEAAPTKILDTSKYGLSKLYYYVYKPANMTCVNLSISTTSTKPSTPIVFNNWTTLSNGTFYLQTTNMWMWADYSCNYSTWRYFQPVLYLRQCAYGTDLCSEELV